jgi:hydrogenase nickel incorporation protein HypA/HybF
MHEMSLVEAIRTIVEDQARAQGFARVTLLRLEIGRFATVERQALDFAWDVVMRGSPADGATLEVIELPGRAMCLDCGAAIEIDNRLDLCPLCSGDRLLPQRGDEMRIRNMEVI